MFVVAVVFFLLATRFPPLFTACEGVKLFILFLSYMRVLVWVTYKYHFTVV